MTEPHWPSPFIEPVAVEAWDAWFRWRNHATVHDMSIEDTWRRVAGALASVEAPGMQARWLSRFLKALATWQLLPDERVLATAGTGQASWDGEALGAALNAAAFIPADRESLPRINLPAVADCAELAVRMLDNAALLAGTPAPRLRIGLIGVADALAMLGYGYDSDAGRAMAASIASAVAEGSFRASTELAVERGPSDDTGEAFARALQCGLAPDLLRVARRNGLRHRQLTAIASRPRLALLANDVANSLDPLLGENHAHTIAVPDGHHTLYSSGYALDMLRTDETPAARKPATLVDVPWIAQIAMRAAVQPWVDEPIVYPLLLERDPDSEQAVELLRQAAVHGVAAPTWRVPVAFSSDAARGTTGTVYTY